jgi:hypothetical protein
MTRAQAGQPWKVGTGVAPRLWNRRHRDAPTGGRGTVHTRPTPPGVVTDSSPDRPPRAGTCPHARPPSQRSGAEQAQTNGRAQHPSTAPSISSAQQHQAPLHRTAIKDSGHRLTSSHYTIPYTLP